MALEILSRLNSPRGPSSSAHLAHAVTQAQPNGGDGDDRIEQQDEFNALLQKVLRYLGVVAIALLYAGGLALIDALAGAR
jgi:hypothetical protein